MNDLHDLLEELSTLEHDVPLDGHTLLAEGRRRVRRRRLVAGSCLSVVALGAVAFGIVHTGHGPADDAVTDQPALYADLDLTPLSVGQVEARCNAPLRQNGVVGGYTIRADTPQQTPRPWHVGSTVLATPDDGSGSTGCTVPESTAPLAPLTMTADAAQVQQICSDDLGIDLAGWQPVAAAAGGGVEAGLYRSANGYLADCHAQHTEMLGVQGDSGIEKVDDWFGYGGCLPTASGGNHCMGLGRVGDHTATQVAITLPSGRVVDRPAVDGYWAIAVRDDASGTTTSAQPLSAVAVP